MLSAAVQKEKLIIKSMKTIYLDMEGALFNDNRKFLSENVITNAGFRELSSNVCYLWNTTSNVVQKVCVCTMGFISVSKFIHSFYRSNVHERL